MWVVWKINILHGDYKKELEELIDERNVPSLFGGLCEDAPYGSQVEQAMLAHVRKMSSVDRSHSPGEMMWEKGVRFSSFRKKAHTDVCTCVVLENCIIKALRLILHYMSCK